MWVLDAWQDAEKVWFPIIWEERKEPSNVVDYDIHGEITKDTSSVINANNDTTTGMANVIPWINAPKLIATTSIIWDLWWGWWWSVIASVQVPVNYFNTWQNEQLKSWITIVNEWWTWFTNEEWTVVVGKGWTYNLHIYITYAFWSSGFSKIIRIYKNSSILTTSTTPLNWEANIDLGIWLVSWDRLTFYCEVTTTAWATLDGNIFLTFTKQ